MSKFYISWIFIVICLLKVTPLFRIDVFADVFNCAGLNFNLPANQKMKCIEKCTLERQGLFDETNGLNVENVVKLDTQAGFNESLYPKMCC